MQEAEIHALELLESLATPGPWYVRQLDDELHQGALTISCLPGTDPSQNMRDGTWPTEEIVAACLVQSPPYASIGDGKFEENARLIASMRNNFSKLLSLAKIAIKQEKGQ